MQTRTRIVSTGKYVPSKVVTNHDLEKMMDTTDEWIQQRSGIKERRWVNKDDTTLSMATAAAKEALENAKLKPDDIDMIIFGALVTDMVFPGTGCMLQHALGMSKNTPALDVRNQCSGFVYSLQVADSLIRSGSYKKILIVGSEIHSCRLDKSPTGRDVGVLFGDAAAAMIVEATTGDSYVIDSKLHSQGEFASALNIQRPSSNESTLKIFEAGECTKSFYPHMEGRLVFKHAVTRMCEVMTELLEKNKVKASDIDFVIAHQANMRINQAVLDQLKIPFEKTHHTLDRYGNTTMATIPITFDEAVALGKIKRGDLVAFVAFGAGFTWGANLVRY